MNPSLCAAQPISTLAITSKVVGLWIVWLAFSSCTKYTEISVFIGIHLWRQIWRGCLIIFRIVRMLTFDPRYPVISSFVRWRSHLLGGKISSVLWCSIQLYEQTLTGSPLSSKIY